MVEILFIMRYPELPVSSIDSLGFEIEGYCHSYNLGRQVVNGTQYGSIARNLNLNQ